MEQLFGVSMVLIAVSVAVAALMSRRRAAYALVPRQGRARSRVS